MLRKTSLLYLFSLSLIYSLIQIICLMLAVWGEGGGQWWGIFL